MWLLRDQRDAELLEWVMVGGLIAGVGLTVHASLTVSALTGALPQIVAAIVGATP